MAIEPVKFFQGTPETTLHPLRVIHCVFGEALSSVFTSQVLARSRALPKDVDQSVMVLTPIGQLLRPNLRERTRQIASIARDQYGLNLEHVLLPPTRLAQFISPERRLTAWLRRRGYSDVVLHCRNAKMAALALKCRSQFPRVKIVYDCRGVECDEFAMNHGLASESRQRWPRSFQKALTLVEDSERLGCREADAVLCVSRVMAGHLQQKYGLECDRFGVIPCCVDVQAFHQTPQQRSDTREKLGVSARFVVTYLGSLAWYQMPDQAIRVFRLIKELREDAHFLAITTQMETMQQALRRGRVAPSDATVLCVAPDRVPDVLPAGDLGLLLREQSIVNRVASPVKFGEYLAAGMPVVVTPNIGDYSDDVVRSKLGCCVSIEASDDEIKSALRAYFASYSGNERHLSTQYAMNHLRWEDYGQFLVELYRRITRESRV